MRLLLVVVFVYFWVTVASPLLFPQDDDEITPSPTTSSPKTASANKSINEAGEKLRRRFMELSLDSRREFQLKLKNEGFYEGEIDGLWGGQTEKGALLQLEKSAIAKEDELYFKNLSLPERESLKYQLTAVGLLEGELDGNWNELVADSLYAYRRSNEIRTWRSLRNALNRQAPVPEHIIAGLEPPLEIVTGRLFLANGYKVQAPFNIVAGSDRSAYAKLRSIESRLDVMTVFIRAGETFRGKAPLGNFEFVYASGEKWYGEKDLFGPSTMLSKSESNLSFIREGQTLRGTTITLRRVKGGKFRTKGIDKSEF